MSLHGNLLARLENKVVFRIAQVIWHGFVWLAWIALVVGVFAWIWSFLPTSRREVVKEAYPPEVEIRASDLTFPAVVNQEGISTVDPSTRNQNPVAPTEGTTTGYEDPIPVPADPLVDRYAAVLDSLAGRHASLQWEDQGTWYIVDQFQYNYWNRKGNPAKADQYRVFMTSTKGLKHHLERFFEQCGLSDHRQRIDVLRGLFMRLDRLAVDSVGSRSVLEKVMGSMAGPQAVLEERLDRCFRLAQSFPEAVRVRAFRKAADLTRKEQPAMGAFLDSVAAVVVAFHPDMRLQVWGGLENQWQARFQNDPARLFQLTRAYVQILPRVPLERQADGLMKYITLYLDRNREREERIAEIEQRHQLALMEAAADEARRKNLKESVGDRAWMAVVGGLLVIAIIALILAVLSMQRAITQLQVVVERSARGGPNPEDGHQA